jgi:hypothetical protein
MKTQNVANVLRHHVAVIERKAQEKVTRCNAE